MTDKFVTKALCQNCNKESLADVSEMVQDKVEAAELILKLRQLGCGDLTCRNNQWDRDFTEQICAIHRAARDFFKIKEGQQSMANMSYVWRRTEALPVQAEEKVMVYRSEDAEEAHRSIYFINSLNLRLAKYKTWCNQVAIDRGWDKPYRQDGSPSWPKSTVEFKL